MWTFKYQSVQKSTRAVYQQIGAFSWSGRNASKTSSSETQYPTQKLNLQEEILKEDSNLLNNINAESYSSELKENIQLDHDYKGLI
jgi:hypothetical protein